jgi:hypothetical protein
VDTGAESGSSEPNAPVYGDAEVEVYKCHPSCPVRILDEQSGVRQSGSEGPNGLRRSKDKFRSVYSEFPGDQIERGVTYADKGGASRFFFVTKPAPKERNAGLEGRSSHPTVKPIQLMRYLVRLVTPPGGLVLDPFLGSGTTVIAATLEGFDSIGIEREDEYIEIARKRCAHWAEQWQPGK